MSHRTIPVFEDANALRRRRRVPETANAFGSGPRIADEHGASFFTTASGIFAALDCASWANVRRAVAADPSVLHVQGCGQHQGALVYPVDYALRLASLWSSLLEHCDRTGVVDPSAVLRDSPLTLRERVTAIANITTWLISVDSAPKPGRDALHVALRAKLASVVFVILKIYPELALAPAVPSLKTPLHFVASMASGTALSTTSFDPGVVAQAILRVPGTSAGCVDAEGRNPLHDLVRSFSVTANPYGLSPTRSRSSSLHSLSPLIELLVVHGADPSARDAAGESSLSLAVRSLDYLAIVHASDSIYKAICSVGQRSGPVGSSRSVTRLNTTSGCPAGIYGGNHECESAGMFGKLPEDIVILIMRKTSPYDAVVALGGSCRLLRRISTREHVWRHLSQSCTLEHVRYFIRNGCERD
jgi:hypothetical protein